MKIKNLTKSLVLFCALFIGAEIQAQKTIETSFEVSGICGMCEDRIEGALDVKGVKMADYDVETNILTIAYNSEKITEDEIHALLNAVGHDTEKSKASKEQYDTVHNCCKYRENDNH
jgi:copper chaperone CopZ